MFKHEKQLFHPVEVERPNPQYAVLLQEQLGGGNGELKAAMQYMSQSFRIKDPEIKDLFLDIAAEELGHMEMVAQTINLLNGHDVDATKVQAGEVQTHVLLGLRSRIRRSEKPLISSSTVRKRIIRCSATPSTKCKTPVPIATSALPKQRKCISLCPIPDRTLLQRARPTLRRLSENNYCYQILYRALEKPPTISYRWLFSFLTIKVGILK